MADEAQTVEVRKDAGEVENSEEFRSSNAAVSTDEITPKSGANEGSCVKTDDPVDVEAIKTAGCFGTGVTDESDVIGKEQNNLDVKTMELNNLKLHEGDIATSVVENESKDVSGDANVIQKAKQNCINIIEIREINIAKDKTQIAEPKPDFKTPSKPESGGESTASNSLSKDNVGSGSKNRSAAQGKVIQNTLSSSLANLLIYSSDDSWDSDEEISEVMNKAALATDEASSDTETDVHVEVVSDSGESDSDDLSYAGSTENKKPPREKLPVSYGDLPMGNLKPLPNISTLKIKEQDCIEMGKIAHIVDDTVMVDSLPNIPAYDIETLLFLDKGKRILGYVFDVIGPVSHPMYAIRFSSKMEIDAQNIGQGTAVYSVPNSKYTQYVFLQQLLQEKGTDASWTDDGEVPDEFTEFSDDEAEFQFKKTKHRGNDKRKRDSLERHQKFENEMNWRNAAESSRHSNSGGQSKSSAKCKGGARSGFKQPNPVPQPIMLPPMPVNHRMHFAPPAYGTATAQCSNFPGQTSTLAYNYVMPELPMYPSQQPQHPPVGINFNPAVLSFPYLFTTPPPPPPENAGLQNVPPNIASPQHFNVPPMQQPPFFAANPSHQQHNKQRRKRTKTNYALWMEDSDDEIELCHMINIYKKERKERNSLKQHRQFEVRMNQRNIEESFRYVIRRNIPSYHCSRKCSKNIEEQASFYCNNDVYCSMYFRPPLFPLLESDAFVMYNSENLMTIPILTPVGNVSIHAADNHIVTAHRSAIQNERNVAVTHST